MKKGSMEKRVLRFVKQSQGVQLPFEVSELPSLRCRVRGETIIMDVRAGFAVCGGEDGLTKFLDAVDFVALKDEVMKFERETLKEVHQ